MKTESRNARAARRRKARLTVLTVLTLIIALVAVAVWYSCWPAAEYVLITKDAEGLQPGDPVNRNGVRVGHVSAVAVTTDGSAITFALEGEEMIAHGDIVRIHKPVLSGQAEIRITQDCGIVGADREANRIPLGREIQESTLVAETATIAVCSEFWRNLGDFFEETGVTGSVERMRAAASRFAAGAAWSREEAGDYARQLRHEGRRLIDRLRAQGQDARADSVQSILEGVPIVEGGGG